MSIPKNNRNAFVVRLTDEAYDALTARVNDWYFAKKLVRRSKTEYLEHFIMNNLVPHYQAKKQQAEADEILKRAEQRSSHPLPPL